jgi:hypothetical protein
MNIVFNVDKNKTDNHQPRVYDLGQITTTLQDLLDKSQIVVDTEQVVVLKIRDIDDNINHYLLTLKNFKGNSIYGAGKNVTVNDLILINGEGSNIIPNLNQVTTEGNRSSNGIDLVPDVNDTSLDEFGHMKFDPYTGTITTKRIFSQDGSGTLDFSTPSEDVTLSFPDKTTGEYVIATTDDIPEPVVVPDFTLEDVTDNNPRTNNTMYIMTGDVTNNPFGSDKHTILDKGVVRAAYPGGKYIGFDVQNNDSNSPVFFFANGAGTVASLIYDSLVSGNRTYSLPSIAPTLNDASGINKLAVVPVLADFVDDAAAAANLIPIGGLYHTSGVVKIRLV